MTVSVITPTCDRPVAFALCERWMARQTRQPDEWIVADGGQTPIRCRQGQQHLHHRQPPGVTNFLGNLQRAVDVATGEIIVIIEDDDWYHPSHIERLLGQLAPYGIVAAGDDRQRYYNVAHRAWKLFPNKGACLCQTGFKRALLPAFRRALAAAGQARSYGVDGRFWAPLLGTAQISLLNTETTLGIKGLPGRVGLGVGHRPQLADWHRDPHLEQLRRWVGDDANVYAELAQAA